MTRATVFQRDDGTLIFRTERGDIENLRKLGDFVELYSTDVYDADVDRLNEFYFYLHQTFKEFSECLSPNLQKEVIEHVGAIVPTNMSPNNWGLFKKGAGII